MRRGFLHGLSVWILLFPFLPASFAETRTGPLLGAQIWIEPGQTPEEIDGWFRQLETSGMPVARLFLMWTYLQPAPDRWDFSLYDAAFRSAEKHHVRIVATLTPNGPPLFLGGDGNQGVGILPTVESKERAAVYLAKIVGRYRSSPALDTWLLVNEPGQAPASTPHAVQAFESWLPTQYATVPAMNLAWGTNYKGFGEVRPPLLDGSGWNHNAELDWRTFWRTFQTEELRWLAEQVRQSDPAHPLHLNPAGILSNLAESSDNLPAWRGFLDTLGCSIHPAWHFGLLDRDRYALGVSYLNDLVRGSMEPKPYWVTELQGGNNIYSGVKPLEPTPSDIAQWLWTSLGAGADRVIFWLLNARREGVEAGEWSLLDFQQQPSDRLTTAATIAATLRQHAAFFAGAKPVSPPVTLLLSLETMTFESAYHHDNDPARDSSAHVLEALGFYEALSRLGVPPAIKHFDDYDWSTASKQPRAAILPDARELTAEQIHTLKRFVEKGNTLLISGLTGFYGPHAKAWPLAGFPLADITGADLKEVHLREITPLLAITGSPVALPSRLWVSSLRPQTATATAQKDDEVLAVERSTAGGGKVIWIPSPIGLGAWLTDATPLALYLQKTLAQVTAKSLFRFDTPQPGCLLRVLESAPRYVTVLSNGGGAPLSCTLTTPPGVHAVNLWGATPEAQGTRANFRLPGRGTSVQMWQ